MTSENKFISDEQRDLIISLIVLKYTQSNSAFATWTAALLPVWAQASRVAHIPRTCLAGSGKSTTPVLRHMPVPALPFRDDAG